MKRILCLVLVLVMFVSIFSACNKKPADNSLRFLDVSPNPTRQAYFENTFAKFEQETGIKVVYESVPWDDAANRIAVMGSANQLPDVMTTWAGWLGQYTDAGWVVPLDNYIGDTRSEYSDLVQNVFWKSEQELYGSTYTVPDGMMVKGVFVRKDWVEEAGITLDPVAGWTYDEFFDLTFKLADESQKRYGNSFRGARGAFDPLLVYLEGFHGGSLYSEDGSVLINDEAGVKELERWCEIYFKGAAPKDAVNWGFSEMVDNFTGGLTGTLINDSEVAATCAENMEDGTWMVMPMPKHPDGKIYNTIGSPYAYSISSSSTQPEEAWKLIEFLSRPDNNMEYCKMLGAIPIKKDVGDDPFFGEDGMYAPFVRQTNDPNVVVPVSFGPFDFTDLHQGMFHEELQKYLLGQQDATASLSNISTELEARMKKYLSENEGSAVETPKSIG